MSELNVIAPNVSSSQAEGDQWLQIQRSFDWSEAGLPDFGRWDIALSTITRLIGRSAAPMSLMLGRKGIILANNAAEKLFFESTGAVNSRSVLDVLPQAREFYASVIERVLAGASLSFEQQPIRLRKNGKFQTYWFNLDFTPVTDQHGKIVGVLGVANDVTLLRRRVRELSDSEQRLRVALDGSGLVGLWTMDIRTNMTTSDYGVSRVYGLPMPSMGEGIAFDTVLAAIHPEDRERVRETMSTAIATRSPYRSRHRVVDTDGEAHWVVASATPIVEDGEVTSLLGVVIEVTDQVQTAQALAKSRFEFQTLTETLPQIVWSCDAEGRHDYFSARWSEFTGIAQQDITEDTWKVLVFPDHQKLVAEVWAKSLATGEPYDIDYRFRHKSGDYRWLRVMALPMRNEEGRITRWFGTSTDVHDAYLMAGEREALARELERIATHDQLTGALTRRAFYEKATKTLQRERRLGDSIGLLMLDIDHFKAINDNHGHLVGDQVLATVGARIAAAVRHVDFLGRLGGEEFAVCLPRCSEEQVLAIAERMRLSLEQEPIGLDNGQTIRVTMSVGATYATEQCLTLSQLLTTADRALYRAKAEGRNTTRLAVE